MMRKDSTKKILDREKSISKRFSALCRYVDNQGEEEVRNFFSANYSVIYSIYLDYLQKIDHSAKQKKKYIENKEITNLTNILRTLFKHNNNIIRGKWQLKSITHELENLLEFQNSHTVRKLGFELLLQFVDILGNRADLKHIGMVMSVLDFSPFVEGKNIVLPTFEGRSASEVELPALPQRQDTSQPQSKEETLDMLGILFNFFKNPQRFPFWWDLFKTRIAVILYPEECKALNVMKESDATGFVHGCPADLHVLVLRMILDCLASPQISSILYGKEVDVVLITYLFRQSFTVPSQYWEDLNAQLQTYRAWTFHKKSLYTTPQIMIDQQAGFLKTFIDHLTQIFFMEKDKNKMNLHLDMSHQVLEIFKHLSRQEIDAPTWEYLLLSYCYIFSHVFKDMGKDADCAEFATKMQKALAKNLFVFLLRAQPDENATQVWNEVLDVVRENLHLSSVMTNWRKTVLNITRALISRVFGLNNEMTETHYDYESEVLELKKKGRTSNKLKNSDYTESTKSLLFSVKIETLLTLFHKVIAMYGEGNSGKSGQLHTTKIKVLSEVIDLFLTISVTEVHVKKGTPPPPFIHSPEGNTLMKLFGEYLLEACCRTDSDFLDGQCAGIVSLCKIFNQKCSQTFKHEYLAEFYRAIYLNLKTGAPDVVKSIIINSTQLFSLNHPGCKILIPIFVQACDAALSNTTAFPPDKELRLSALKILSSILVMSYHYQDATIPAVDEEFLPKSTKKGGESGVLSKKPMSTYTEVNALLRLIIMRAMDDDTYPECQVHCIWSLFNIINRELNSSSASSKNVQNLLSRILPLISDKSEMVSRSALEAIDCLSNMKLLGSLKDAVNRSLVDEIVIHICKVLIVYIREIQNRQSGKEKIIELMYYVTLGVVINFPSCLDNQEVCNMLFDIVSLGLLGEMSSHYEMEDDLQVPQAPPKEEAQSGRRGFRERLGGVMTRRETKQAMNPVSKNSQIEVVALSVYESLLNLLNNFPSESGPSQMSSNVKEYENLDLDSAPNKETESKFVEATQHMYHFVFNNTTLFTVFEQQSSDNSASTTRVIVRDLTGKYCWESSQVFKPQEHLFQISSQQNQPESRQNENSDNEAEETAEDSNDESQENTNQEQEEESFSFEGAEYPHFDPSINYDKVDILDHLLKYVKKKYPHLEKFANRTIPKEDVIKSPEDIRKNLVKQVEFENEILENKKKKQLKDFQTVQPPQLQDGANDFYRSFRSFLNQFGFLSSINRPTFTYLDSNQRFYRELKQLDKLYERETIKVGVIYVKNGQESQREILKNDNGSHLYEEFIQSLGWMVELSKHQGFIGGLDPLGTTGTKAPYWSNSSTEVVFHCPTLMPTKENDEQQVHKKRHVGNDHVHIVWSEHDRDYRSWTIRSQFNFVHIVIYPLDNYLFRVQIFQKENVPPFGPLRDGMVVDKKVLAPLVRMTAINANRAVRYQEAMYKRPYPTRMQLIEEIVDRFKKVEASNEDYLLPLFQA
eukprot:gb/GECH01000255.1/.p1 GENE.gb/GECH01000255.1/~~gb/GECH01000255.1/.p1  ORF type:complete len:1486 (+),score=342.16 gb/GECH01000255.1/:1-4458(+)